MALVPAPQPEYTTGETVNQRIALSLSGKTPVSVSLDPPRGGMDLTLMSALIMFPVKSD